MPVMPWVVASDSAVSMTGVMSDCGISAAAGIGLGVMGHVVIAAAGLAVLLITYPVAYDALRYAGAAYLLWLAYHTWTDTSDPARREGRSDIWRAFRRGFLTNILNPKVGLFVLAFLPQFANPALGSITLQMMIFGGLFIIATLLCFGSVAWFAGFLGEWLKGSIKAQLIMNRIAGTVFVALALRLAVSER